MHFPRLAELRRESQLTQQEVADLLFLKREVYRRYEKGTREVPTWAIVQLCRLYHVSSDYILGLTDERARE